MKRESIKWLAVIITAAMSISLTFLSAQECPETSCKGGRIEMQPEFVVTVTHEGKPLPGAIVEVTTEQNGETASAISGETSADGTIMVKKITPGEYWITTSYLGHESLQCIRVSAKPSKDAKREFSYAWGDGAPATKQVAGKLVDLETGEGIAGARLKLRSPARPVASVVTGVGGSFAFANTPPGTYVLNSAAGTSKAGKRYIDSEFVLAVSPEAKANQLTVKRRGAPNGECRNPPSDLELKTE